MTRLLLLLWAFIAEIMGTIAGFGSSSIFLPLASQTLPFTQALLLVALYHIFWNMSRLSIFYKHWNKKIFILFWLPSVVATVIGAYLAAQVPQDILKILFGVVLAVFALYSYFTPILFKNPHPRLGRIWWALSWFSAGLIGTWWVLRWAFMSIFNLPKEQYIATIASIALLVDFTRIPIYFWQWFLNSEYIRLIPVLFVIAFVGSWTGRYIVRFIPQALFRKLILWAIWLLSLLIIVQWAWIV